MIPENYKGPRTFLKGFWPMRVLCLVWLGLLFLGCLWEVKADGLTADQLSQLKIEFQTLKKQTAELKVTLDELAKQNATLMQSLTEARQLSSSLQIRLNELTNNWEISKAQNLELRNYLNKELEKKEGEKILFGAIGLGIGTAIAIIVGVTK